MNTSESGLNQASRNWFHRLAAKLVDWAQGAYLMVRVLSMCLRPTSKVILLALVVAVVLTIR